MSSKPQGNSQNHSADSSDRASLPFEPTKSRKQTGHQTERKGTEKKTANAKQESQGSSAVTKSKPAAKAGTATGIPDAVSRRMVKRMAIFCGIPTALGMSTFIVSYLVIANDLYQVPTYAVLLLSLGFFGMGVLGLSYGALSASWDEEVAGSRLGWSEFATNWGRMTVARKAANESAGKTKP